MDALIHWMNRAERAEEVCNQLRLVLESYHGRVLEKKSDSDSIVDNVSLPPMLEFEGYVIRPFDGWRLWMENSAGEGTCIAKMEFLATLMKLFNRNM